MRETKQSVLKKNWEWIVLLHFPACHASHASNKMDIFLFENSAMNKIRYWQLNVRNETSSCSKSCVGELKNVFFNGTFWQIELGQFKRNEQNQWLSYRVADVKNKFDYQVISITIGFREFSVPLVLQGEEQNWLFFNGRLQFNQNSADWHIDGRYEVIVVQKLLWKSKFFDDTRFWQVLWFKADARIRINSICSNLHLEVESFRFTPWRENSGLQTWRTVILKTEIYQY